MEFENIVGNEMKKTMIWKCEFVNHSRNQERGREGLRKASVLIILEICLCGKWNFLIDIL